MTAVMRHQRLPRNQAGFSLLEVTAAIAISALVMLGVLDLIGVYSERLDATRLGERQRFLVEASQRYIQDNYASGDNLVGAVSPDTPTVVPLANMAEYLPAGFDVTNQAGQVACLLVAQPAAGEPLRGFVVNTGGDPFNDAMLSSAARVTGASGGAIHNDTAAFGSGFQGMTYSLDPATLNLYGSGECPTSSGLGSHGVNLTAGHPVANVGVEPGRFDSGVLYRDAIAGRPELNRMNTDIDMGNNNVENARDVYANRDIVAGNRVVAQKDIGTTEGDVIALDGEVIANDTVMRDMSIGGNHPQGSDGVYYSRVVRPGGSVPKPNCPGGKSPLLYASPASYLYVRDGRARLTYGTVTTATDKGGSWMLNILLLREDGRWVSADPDYSRITSYVKCSG